MKDFFKDIFDYHLHFNQLLVDHLIANEIAVSQHVIPLFSHCLNAHQIWNARIQGDPPFGVFDVHALDQCKTIDQDNYQRSLVIINERDFMETIEYKNSKGQALANSVQEILFHVCNHFTHHKGQIMSDLRRSGIEPIVTDYIFYKRQA